MSALGGPCAQKMLPAAAGTIFSQLEQNGNLCEKLLFRLVGASGRLPVASGPQSGFAKSVAKMCIICTWAPLWLPLVS